MKRILLVAIAVVVLSLGMQLMLEGFGDPHAGPHSFLAITALAFATRRHWRLAR